MCNFDLFIGQIVRLINVFSNYNFYLYDLFKNVILLYYAMIPKTHILYVYI